MRLNKGHRGNIRDCQEGQVSDHHYGLLNREIPQGFYPLLSRLHRASFSD